MPAFVGFSASGGVDGWPHLRQRPGTRPEPLGSLHLSHIPFHLKAGEPLHIAREVDIRAHALPFVGGGIGRPALDDLIARLCSESRHALTSCSVVVPPIRLTIAPAAAWQVF